MTKIINRDYDFSHNRAALCACVRACVRACVCVSVSVCVPGLREAGPPGVMLYTWRNSRGRLPPTMLKPKPRGPLVRRTGTEEPSITLTCSVNSGTDPGHTVHIRYIHTHCFFYYLKIIIIQLFSVTRSCLVVERSTGSVVCRTNK